MRESVKVSLEGNISNFGEIWAKFRENSTVPRPSMKP